MSEARQRNVVEVRPSPGHLFRVSPGSRGLDSPPIEWTYVGPHSVSSVSKGRKLHWVTCKVLLSRVPSLLLSPTIFSASALWPWAFSPVHLLIWRQNDTAGTQLLRPLHKAHKSLGESSSGQQAGEPSPAACACTVFSHCHPKEEQAASCLGVGFALGSYFSYLEAAGDGCPTKIA